MTPSPENGLQVTSRLMVDKITTVSRARVRRRIGRLNADDLMSMNRAVAVFLGLGSYRARVAGEAED